MLSHLSGWKRRAHQLHPSSINSCYKSPPQIAVINRFTGRAGLFKWGERLDNLREFILLLVLISGISLANESLGFVRAIHFSALSLAPATADIFVPLIDFAFAFSTILAALHSLQWIVSARF